VSDGTRTRDTRDHNPVLYQLSYTHHRTRPTIVAAQVGSVLTTSAAAFCACSVLGPGGGTNTVPR
jgi:hypothetical protein